MENIIQQIALDLVEKITKKAFEAKISDIDTLASDVLADCKTAACEILEAAVAQLNESIRKEKATRKELGLILKEKNRKRSILTELGTLNKTIVRKRINCCRNCMRRQRATRGKQKR